MKRTIAIVITLILALSCLAACGGGGGGDKNVLRVGTECEYAPYNWMQATDANGAVPIHGSSDFAYGYDIMIAKYLAEKMGYELEIHRMDWDSLPPAVLTGAVDCVIAGMSITAERQMTLDFTTPYYYASIVALVRGDSEFAGATGLAGLAGANATSQLNTVWYDIMLPQIPGINIQSPMDSAPAMLVSLTSGAVDLVVTDMPTAQAAVIVYPELKILDFSNSSDGFSVSDEEVNLGIPVNKGNKELLDKLNGALATLTVADFEKMMTEAIKVQPLDVD